MMIEYTSRRKMKKFLERRALLRPARFVLTTIFPQSCRASFTSSASLLSPEFQCHIRATGLRAHAFFSSSKSESAAVYVVYTPIPNSGGIGRNYHASLVRGRRNFALTSTSWRSNNEPKISLSFLPLPPPLLSTISLTRSRTMWMRNGTVYFLLDARM